MLSKVSTWSVLHWLRKSELHCAGGKKKSRWLFVVSSSVTGWPKVETRTRAGLEEEPTIYEIIEQLYYHVNWMAVGFMEPL